MMSIWLLPLLTCLILVFIHVYFGAFVLRRGILFIDLALAQWAALGYLLGHWAGISHPVALFGMAFGATLIAGAMLSLLKPLYREDNLQEAVIGVMYILAAALATGLIVSSGMEGHHLQDMLAGHLLFVTKGEWLAASSHYIVIALILWRVHHFLIQQSTRSDFLFYVLFGAVVTSSVRLVGILLVFAFLVLPILTVFRQVQTFQKQVLVGWGIGFVASVIGLMASLAIDIPPSYAVILALCAIWLTTAIAMRLIHKPDSHHNLKI